MSRRPATAPSPESNTTPTFDGPRLPLKARAINAVGRVTERLGKPLAPISLSRYQAKARARTRLHDFGGSGVPDGFEDRARRFLCAIEEDDQLTLMGRLFLRDYMVTRLMARLRIQSLITEHPEIREIPIERPIFIVGWPRTGTTVLHHLMALDANARAPRLWQLRNPCPEHNQRDSDPGARIRDTERVVEFIHSLAPGMLIAHPLDAQMPDECQFLFDNDFFTAMFIAFQASSYAEWLFGEADPLASYEYYRLQLQILAWQQPGGHAVLKWPFHLWYLDTLFRVFPDARVIQTHRDLTRALPSLCSLNAIVRSMFNRHLVDPHELGRFWLEQCARGISRGMRARADIEGIEARGSFYDMFHPRLVADHAAEVRRIYEHFGMPYTVELDQRIRAYVRDNPREGVGKHSYTMARFGLDEAQLRARFADYLERFETR